MFEHFSITVLTRVNLPDDPLTLHSSLLLSAPLRSSLLLSASLLQGGTLASSGSASKSKKGKGKGGKAGARAGAKGAGGGGEEEDEEADMAAVEQDRQLAENFNAAYDSLCSDERGIRLFDRGLSISRALQEGVVRQCR